MVRVALLFALAAVSDGVRSNVELIDAQLAEANMKIADKNFDYEAADALDDALDLDEELSAGDFQFEDSAPGAWNWGPPGQNHCPGGSTSVSEYECLAAVQSMLGGQRQGRRHLVSGSWGWVPPGCSAQTGRTHNQRGDNAAHFNRNHNGRNDGGYTPACSPQGFHGAGWVAPPSNFHPGSGVGFGAGNVLVADGCRRSQGSRNPEMRSAVSGFASVRCCSNTGRRCETSSIGCLQHQTYGQAQQACARRNMRLCTVPELDSGVCCGTGCGFDGHHVWTLAQGAGAGYSAPGFSVGGITISLGGGAAARPGFNAGSRNFMIVDGCSSRSGRQTARSRSAISGQAPVRCCSFDGRRCESQSLGCQQSARYSEANSICAGRGLRLCAQHELERGVCCGTGCGFDARRVWTNTPAR